MDNWTIFELKKKKIKGAADRHAGTCFDSDFLPFVFLLLQTLNELSDWPWASECHKNYILQRWQISRGKNCLAPRFRHVTSYFPHYTIVKRELHRGTWPDSPSSWHRGAGWRMAKAIMRCLNKHWASMKKLISCAFNQPSWSEIMTIFESQWHCLLVFSEL